MKKTFCLLILLYAGKCVLAQDTARLFSDRPDQTDGANILKKGELQIESEFYYNTFNEGRAAFISSSLLRYGLHKSLEVRLLVEDGRERDKFIEETTQGLYPLALSAKLALLKDHPALPDIVFISYLKMPFTRRTSKDVYWSPAFLIGLEKDIHKFTIAFNAGIKQSAFEKKWSWQASADVKYNLTKHIEIFSEYFGNYTNHGNPAHNADAGLLYYLTNNFIIHLVYGSTIFTNQHNRFINTGFAFRVQ